MQALSEELDHLSLEGKSLLSHCPHVSCSVELSVAASIASNISFFEGVIPFGIWNIDCEDCSVCFDLAGKN